jgi:hypothetical protein
MKENSNLLVTETYPTTASETDRRASSPNQGLGVPGAEESSLDILHDNPLKRPPGRPKGLGKVPGSGRKSGTPNKMTKDVREYIMDKGRPLELLFKIARGYKVKVGDPEGNAKKIYPSLTDRAAAAKTLLAKCIPDIKATEISGPEGGPIESRTDGALAPMTELARRLAFVMASGEVEIAKPEHPCDGLSPSRPKTLSETRD